MRTADATGCKVILANDPDADRLAVAEKNSDDSWKVFTGNELGMNEVQCVYACLLQKFHVSPYMPITN